MRQIDKMSKDEILDFLQRCEHRLCENCPADAFHSDGAACTCAAHYLAREISPKLVPRWATIKSDTDIETMLKVLNQTCERYETCGECPYDDDAKTCRVLFFCEKVEVFE